jgi:hypothetical protein
MIGSFGLVLLLRPANGYEELPDFHQPVCFRARTDPAGAVFSDVAPPPGLGRKNVPQTTKSEAQVNFLNELAVRNHKG